MAMNASEREIAERRESLRAPLRLRLAVVYPQQEGHPVRPIHHATTHDICMSGLSVVTEENFFHGDEVTLLLALPPVHAWAAQKIISVTAEITYALHSSKSNGYRIGLAFRKFEDDGQDLLEAALRRALNKDDDTAATDAGLDAAAARRTGGRPLGR